MLVLVSLPPNGAAGRALAAVLAAAWLGGVRRRFRRPRGVLAR